MEKEEVKYGKIFMEQGRPTFVTALFTLVKNKLKHVFKNFKQNQFKMRPLEKKEKNHRRYYYSEGWQSMCMCV